MRTNSRTNSIQKRGSNAFIEKKPAVDRLRGAAARQADSRAHRVLATPLG
jgi:hypothetical protein